MLLLKKRKVKASKSKNEKSQPKIPEIQFLKLINNSLYGKIIEKVRKIGNVRFATDAKEYKKLIHI